jgi:hypothetical protein
MDEKRILEDCLQAARDLLGLEISPITVEKQVGPVRPDAVVRLTLPSGKTIDVCVEVKTQLRPSKVPEIRAQLATYKEQTGCSAVLVAAPYVPESLAQRLRNQGLWFVDSLGNAYIEVPGTLLIYAVGKRPAHWQPSNATWMSAQGAKVLFQLLILGPRVHATYRDIAQNTGVSLGMVSRIITSLTGRGVISRRAHGLYEIVEPRRLLEMWSDAYALKLRPRILLGRFRSPFGADFTRMFEQLASKAEMKNVVVGGEYAADRFTGYLRAGSLSLYVPPDRVRAVRRVLRLAPSSEGNIELYEAFAKRLKMPRARKWPPLAHPVLVYAELLATDDPRCGEAALRLKERHLPWIP